MEIDIGNVVIDEELNIGELQLDFIQIILRKPNQEKEVTPTKQEQNIFADTGYELEKVIVKPIPSEYIVPIGSVDIVENGIYNVKDKVTANVNIPEKQLGTKTITTNGIYKATDDNLDGYSEVEVETSGVDINDYFETNYTGSNYFYFIKKVPNNILIKGTSCSYMFQNFKMLSEISNLDTSSVTNMQNMFDNCTSLTTIPELNTSSVTNMNSMFYRCTSLTTIPELDTSSVINMSNLFFNCTSLTAIPQLDTSKVTYMNSMFYNCSSLITVPQLDTSSVINMSNLFFNCTSLTAIPQLDTSKVTYMNYMFYNCSSLITVPELDASSVTNIAYMFIVNSKLTNMGGLKNLGMAYLTTQSANYSNYKLDLSYSPLTHESLMNVINNLYDIKTKGCNVQQLVLGSTNLAKLTAEEIAIATNKGFNVS